MSQGSDNQPIYESPQPPVDNSPREDGKSANFLLANTTNHRRLLMFLATALLGTLIQTVVFKLFPSILDPLIAGFVGALMFELLFRTRQWLRPITLPVYVLLVALASQWLYGILYGGSWLPWDSLSYLVTGFPYNLYALIEAALVTGVAYYLIKIYRHRSWNIAAAEPQPEGLPLSKNERTRQFLVGFVGWYLANGLTWYALVRGSNNAGEGVFMNIILFPINLLALIILSAIKRTQRVGLGILAALALNLGLSLVLAASINGFCFIPFYVR